MATVHRHAIPPESFAPDRPLNDLLQQQLHHFRFIEPKLPVDRRPVTRPAAPDNPIAASRYVADMTALIHGTARLLQPLTLVPPKPARPRRSPPLAIAASVEPETAAAPSPPVPKRKKKNTPRKRKGERR